MQGTWVQFLVQENPTCCQATKPMCHTPEACALQQEEPQQLEKAGARQQRPSTDKKEIKQLRLKWTTDGIGYSTTKLENFDYT